MNLAVEPSPRTTAPAVKISNGHVVSLFLALILGGAARLYPALTHDFPVADGGLFLLMSQVIRENHFVLPAFVPYGTGVSAVPFCYPPLAFYQVAFLNLFGFSFETLLRFLPALWATSCIYAVWRLARVVLSDHPKGDQIAGIATLIWALFPWSFYWMVMGGGLTRAPGLLFAIVGVEYGLRLWRDQERKAIFVVTLCLALATLTHLERAHFLGVTLILVWALFAARSNWRSVGQLVLIFAGALLLTAPWWGLCLSRFGLSPFLAAMSSGGASWITVPWYHNLYNNEYYFPFLTVIGFIGGALFIRARPFLGLWLVVILFVEIRSPRNFLTFPLAISAALLLCSIPISYLRFGLLSFGIFWIGLQSSMASYTYKSITPLQRLAMEWARQNTASQARFLVFPDPLYRGQWYADLITEWMPGISRRTNIITVQGTEWLPNHAFARQMRNYEFVAGANDWPEVQSRCTQKNLTFDWFFIAREKDPRSKRVAAQITADPNFQLAYQNPGVLIFKRKVSAPPAQSAPAPAP